MASEFGDLYGKSFGKTGVEFIVGKRIGEGGYGEVYRATQIEIERVVALKVLRRPETGRYPEKLQKRFLREAKIIGSLRDHHTVKLIEYGTDLETKILYMAFEFIDGVTIGEVISSERGVGPGRVVDILRQALLSLEEAHEIGVVHRDIKPGNIMLYEYMNRRDQIKVLDFGIGKLMSETTDARLTAVGSLVGTPKYMSPEQILGDEGEVVGPQADIFSLGLVAWEMLTGHSLLPMDPMVVTGRLLNDEKFELPKHVCLEAPGVRSVVEKMLEKDRRERYQNASEVIRDLGHLRALSESEVSTVTSLPLAPTVAPRLVSTPIQVELVGGPLPFAQPSSARLPWALLAGLVVIVALTAVAYVWSFSNAATLSRSEASPVVELPRERPTLVENTQKTPDLIGARVPNTVAGSVLDEPKVSAPPEKEDIVKAPEVQIFPVAKKITQPVVRVEKLSVAEVVEVTSPVESVSEPVEKPVVKPVVEKKVVEKPTVKEAEPKEAKTLQPVFWGME